jgi:branched-chain amino acid transport system substrate-binding protein
MTLRAISVTLAGVLVVLGLCAAPASVSAAGPSDLKVGIVTFLSGAASGPFGIPAKTAAEFWIDRLNQQGGIGGAKIVPTIIDEAGTTDQVVTNYRRLVTDQKVDVVIGYI